MCSYEIIWLNYNENDGENEKQITKIRHKQTWLRIYTINKTCLSMMMVMCNKQHLNNI